MKAYEIAQLIEKEAPQELAYSWDNVGILCGDGKKEVKKALLTLDTNENTVDEAIQNKCDMIISHHPILLGGIKRIDYSSADGRMLRKRIQNDITVFAAHTNMDTAEHGINDALALLLGIKDAEIIEKNGEKTGLGRYGKLIHAATLREFAELVKKKLGTPHVRTAGDLGKTVITAAVASGSCAELIPAAHALGCNVIVTADMKYHNMIAAAESGIAVIDAGHYPTEIIVMDIFEKILRQTNIITVKSKNTDIFTYI